MSVVFNSIHGGAEIVNSFLMLVALSGLGCQNKTADQVDLPTVLSPAPASPSIVAAPAGTTPPPYPRYYPENLPDVEEMYSNHWSSFHATLYSFVFGHDPGIPSAREIEESVFGYRE